MHQIIPAPSAIATTAGITLGSVGLLMLGLQPLLLGVLLTEHRLTVPQLTQAATVELLVLGATAGLMGGLLPHRALRAIALLGCGILVAGNAASLAATGFMFVAGRALAGLGGGITVWIAIGVITHGRAPARLSGLFLALQTAAQALLAAILPISLMPTYGANGGFIALAAISAFAVVTIPFLPAALPTLPKPEAGHGGLNLAGMLGLASAFLFMAGIVGAWVFVDAVAVLNHITPIVAHYAVALALVSQVIGALAATVLAHRLPVAITLVTAALGCLAAVAVMAAPPGDWAFMAAVLLYGFLWLFTLPFQIPLLFAADPTRRAAMLLAGAQLLGGSAGPQITGLFATEITLWPALAAAAGLFGLCLLCTVATAARIGRKEAVLF